MSEKAVIATEPEPQASEQASDAQGDDLDTLLSQYEEETQDKTAPKEPSGKLDEVVRFIEQQREREARQESEKALNDAVASAAEIAGFEKVSDAQRKIILGLLHYRASEDPRVRQAFVTRDEKPAAWRAVIREVAKEAQQSFSPADDHDAVASAVRGASTARAEPEKEFPSDAEFSRMSDADFNKFTSQF